MPYIICPIVIKFYTNCGIFMVSRRPQSNTYQCAGLHLVNVRVPERHNPIRFVTGGKKILLTKPILGFKSTKSK